jgi:hypothetical protein
MSQIQQVQGATVQDAETALFQEVGKHDAEEVFRDTNQVQWVVSLSSGSRRIHAKCTIANSRDGVSIQLAGHFRKPQWIALIICYALCIIPGVAISLQMVIVRFFANRRIADVLPHIVTTTQALAKNRQAAPPPMPT